MRGATASSAVLGVTAFIARLIREHSGFHGPGLGCPASNGLHKAFVDAAVFDPGPLKGPVSDSRESHRSRG